MTDKVDDLVKEVVGQDTNTLKNKILSTTKGYPSFSLLELCRVIDASVKDIEEAIVELKVEGFDIEVQEHAVNRTFVPPPGHEQHLFQRIKDSGTIKFGLLSDTHYGNIHSRQDVIEAAYDHFEAEGITTVYLAGNLIDGYHPMINHNELLPDCFDLEGQLTYAAEHFPKKKGITTYYIAAEDHEGWWHRKTGLNVGRVMQQYFHHNLDRKDLNCVGFGECDIELRIRGMKKEQRGPIMRLSHPGGGSSYAYSYKTQKQVEAYQGGEKPQLLVVGHYHKYDANYHREVLNIQVGCCEDQTWFMRKHNLAAHVGYVIAEAKIHTTAGTLESLKHEFVPWYDKGYYHKWMKREV